MAIAPKAANESHQKTTGTSCTWLTDDAHNTTITAHRPHSGHAVAINDCDNRRRNTYTVGTQSTDRSAPTSDYRALTTHGTMTAVHKPSTNRAMH